VSAQAALSVTSERGRAVAGTAHSMHAGSDPISGQSGQVFSRSA